MKTNRNFCVVVLCAMLIAAVGCNSNNGTSGKINIVSAEEPELILSAYLDFDFPVEGYDELPKGASPYLSQKYNTKATCRKRMMGTP